MMNMKKTAKLLAVILLLAVTISAVPVTAGANPVKCKTTVNGQSVDWQLEPFLAYGPHHNVLILIPMKDFFTTLGYTITYDAKRNRSVFTANADSDYVSFFADIKTGQVIKEGEDVPDSTLNCAYLINDNLYVIPNDYFSLDKIAKSFLNGAVIEIDYASNHTEHEDFIVQYSDNFPVQNNLSSLRIKVFPSSYDKEHPYAGDEFTKYNTGEYILGSVFKRNFKEVNLRSLWDGFDKLHFYTGEREANQLSGNGKWNSKYYAVAWDLMEEAANEINRLRKQNGLPELAVDNSMCFRYVGAEDPKVNSVFDNAIRNIEIDTAYHTFNDKTKYYECMAAATLRGEKDPETLNYDKSTSIVGRNIVEQWYGSAKGHREILLNKKITTMGILVIVTDTRAADAYAVFK
jgi:hypothetical protein